MRNSITEHLVCVTDNCNSLLKLEHLSSTSDDCTEGFLRCSRCDASYPIINGVAIIVNDFTNYISQRTKILGKWLLECKTDPMKKFIRKQAKDVQKLAQNRYEEGGTWFEPYLYMRSPKTKIDKRFSQIINENFDNFYSRLANLILDKFSDNKMCLDLGCATGTVTYRLAKKLDFVFGVDQSFSFVREARKQNKDNMEFLVADSLKLPFKNNKFDLVISLNVLDLVNPEKLLRYIHSLLKPAGSMVITDPYDFRDEKGDPNNTHDGKSIRKFLMNNGFTIDKNTQKESFLPWVLRINRRAYLLYFADLIIAKRSV